MSARWLALALLFAAACNIDFAGDQMSFPDDIPCSEANTCPPNEVCVPGEHYCRYPCGSDGSCPSAHMNAGVGLGCDVDHFCRIHCGGGGTGMCGRSDCPTDQICNGNGPGSLCHAICTGTPNAITCGPGFTCVTASGNSCGGCIPNP